MAAKWFCNIEGTELGPISSEQLRGLVEKGRLKPDDQIRQGTEGAWIPATRIKGLFPASGQAVPDSGEIPVAKAVNSARSKPAKAKPESRRPPRSKKLPVAQATPEPPVAKVPQAKPVEAPPVPPVATPAARVPPTAAPAQSQFGIVADDRSPAAKATGRPTGGDPLARKKKKQQQNLIMVGVLLVLLIALGVGGIVAVNMAGNTSDEPEGSTAEAPGESEVPSESTASGPDAAEPSTAAVEKPPEPKWADASQGATERVGDVQVKIVSAGIGKAPWGRRPKSTDPDAPMLLLSLEVRNLTSQKKIKYDGWSPSSRSRSGMKLVDDLGNEYEPPKAGSTIDGQLTATSLYPNKTLTDLLVFEPPIDRAKFLQLQLPSAAFGELGYLRFKIPTEWLEEVPDEPAAEEPKPGPTREPSGGVPEIERGIEEVRDNDPFAEPRRPEPAPEPREDVEPGTIDELFRDSPDLRGGDRDTDGMETLDGAFDQFNQPEGDRTPDGRLRDRREERR